MKLKSHVPTFIKCINFFFTYQISSTEQSRHFNSLHSPHVTIIEAHTKYNLVEIFLQIKIFKISNKIWECEPFQFIISATFQKLIKLNLRESCKLKKKSKKKKSGNCKMTFQVKSISKPRLNITCSLNENDKKLKKLIDF